MDFRRYLASDRDACLAIFDSDVPEFFDASERGKFEQFLDRPDGPYFVMDHDGTLVGCGGYVVVAGESVANLIRGMVRRDSQNLGLGRFLLMYRLREIGKIAGIGLVRLETPQRIAAFFEKQGFRVAGRGPTGVEMVKKMNVCA
jgi:GNAT superfamily N-acetyltransferase